MTPIFSRHEVEATSGQEPTMRAMLRSLLGDFDFDRLCHGVKVGGISEDILQIFVPNEDCAAYIRLHHSDDLAVAAEYAIGLPIRMVNILAA